MPTKTAEGLSMTLPCECGLRPKRLSGFGTAKVGAAPSSVPGLQAQGGHGLTPTFSLAGFVPAGNSDIQGGPSRDTATSRERRALAKRYGVSRPEMAQEVAHRRCADGPKGAPFNRSDARGGGDHRRLPTAYPAAAGRLPLRPTAHHPAPHP